MRRRRAETPVDARSSSARATRRFLSNVNACYAARLLGGDPLPRGRLRRGPGVRRRHAGRRLEQGLPPRRRGAARPRLRRDRVHAPLLRRVPRAAREHRPRRAVRPAASARHVAPDGRGRPPLDGRAGLSASERARWTARAAAHHGGRRVFSALGSRAERLPAPVRARLSLEGRDGALAAAQSNGRGPHGRRPRARRRPRFRSTVRRDIDQSCRAKTTTWSRASGARARRRCSIPCPGWPSASGCASRW